MQIFTFKKADSPRLLQESYSVRYQVYCKECNFISEEDCREQFENDEFDGHSLHFVALDSKKSVIGSVRMILPSVSAFPIEQLCSDLNIDPGGICRSHAAEISRLVVSKIFRRESGPGSYYNLNPGRVSSLKEKDGRSIYKRIMPIAFGLYREMYKESRRCGIRYWFALMEKKLWLLSKMYGIVFTPIGDEVECYGRVRPYVADLNKVKRIPTDYFLDN